MPRITIDGPHPELETIPNDNAPSFRPWHSATVYINEVPHHLTFIPVIEMMGRQKAEPGYLTWFKGMHSIDKPERGYQTVDLDGVPHVACLTPFEK